MKEEGAVPLPTHIGLLKPALDWSLYRDANPVPTSPLADDITTAPSGSVLLGLTPSIFMYHKLRCGSCRFGTTQTEAMRKLPIWYDATRSDAEVADLVRRNPNQTNRRRDARGCALHPMRSRARRLLIT